MAGTQTTEVFNCTPEQFFALVTDYESYPDFLQEVRECNVLKEEGGKKLVEYKVSVIKSFTYSLWMSESAPHEVTWSFANGDLFKKSDGFWKLEEEAGKTRATYSVEAKFNVFVPGPVAKALVSVNLPAMMSSYHKRVSELYGG